MRIVASGLALLVWLSVGTASAVPTGGDVRGSDTARTVTKDSEDSPRPSLSKCSLYHVLLWGYACESPEVEATSYEHSFVRLLAQGSKDVCTLLVMPLDPPFQDRSLSFHARWEAYYAAVESCQDRISKVVSQDCRAMEVRTQSDTGNIFADIIVVNGSSGCFEKTRTAVQGIKKKAYQDGLARGRNVNRLLPQWRKTCCSCLASMGCTDATVRSCLFAFDKNHAMTFSTACLAAKCAEECYEAAHFGCDTDEDCSEVGMQCDTLRGRCR